MVYHAPLVLSIVDPHLAAPSNSFTTINASHLTIIFETTFDPTYNRILLQKNFNIHSLSLVDD